MKNTGTLVGAPIRINDSADLYPSAYLSEIKGGARVVATMEEMYALSNAPDRLEEFVTRVYVTSTNAEYRLISMTEAHAELGWEMVASYNFEFVTAPGGVLHVSTMGTKKITIVEDTYFDALGAKPGMSGTIIAVIDDPAGHVFYLAEGNLGPTLVSNTLARAETELKWMRTDNAVYWTSRVLKEGIEQTVKPVFAIDDYYKTLDIFAAYPYSEIVMSTNSGPFLPFTGRIDIADIDRPAGYWKAKIISATDRLESALAISLPTYQGRRGFPFVLPLTLT